MPENYAKLIRANQIAIVRAWVDEMYSERRTELTDRLSYEQLVDHLPDVLEEIIYVLEASATDDEIIEASRRLRSHAHVRFRQGILLDEMARELMIFRKVFEDFLWREAFIFTEESLWELRGTLRRTGRFMDELLVQALVIYATSMRPPVETRASVWPPPRRRKAEFPPTDQS